MSTREYKLSHEIISLVYPFLISVVGFLKSFLGITFTLLWDIFKDAIILKIVKELANEEVIVL